MYGRATTAFAGVAAQRATNLTWRAALGRQPPATPENPEVTMREAVIFAIVSGSVTQVARIVATRKAVDYWVRSTGELPPGIKPSQVSPGITRD